MSFWDHLFGNGGADKEILSRLDAIDKQLRKIMATSKELLELAKAVATEVGNLGTAINTLEAAVTAALAKIPSIPPEVQTEIDEAMAALQTAFTDATAAVADAADGVDESVVVPPA